MSAGFLLGSLWAIAVFVSAEEIALKGAVSSEVQEIEIVYAEGHAPKVSLKGKISMAPRPSFRPRGSPVDLFLLLDKVWSFGNCIARADLTGGQLRITMEPANEGLCGHVLPLRQQGTALDALSYDTLHLRGETSGQITVALVDEIAERREETVPLTRVSGRFDIRVSLAPAARNLDMRRLVSIILIPEAKPNTMRLEVLTLERGNLLRKAASGLGFWIWDTRYVLANSRVVLENCHRYGVRRIMVQMPSSKESAEIWTSYASFLQEAWTAGIEAFALDGYPEAIHAPEALANKVTRLTALMGGRRLAGVQLDIEPYLLENFFVDESGFVQYLAAIDRVKAALKGSARLSVTMPFWFTSYTVQGRPVAFAVMDRADEVAIMSYRTDMNELRAVSEDALRYGDLSGVPVWLAIETRPLPLERHLTLKREPQRDLADAYLDRTKRKLVLKPPPSTAEGDWFRVYSRVTVWPERLTFARQSRKHVQAAVAAIGVSTPNPSLAGVIIHDLHGFISLSE